MPKGRPNKGARLALLKKPGWRDGIWYIRWTDESGIRRERSTGTSDRRQAEQIFGAWLISRGQSPGEPQQSGPRYPAETTIAETLSIYGTQRAPQLLAPRRVGQCIRRLLEWWGNRKVDAVRPEACRRYVADRVQAGSAIANAGKELAVLRAAIIYSVKNGYLTSAPFVELPPAQPGRERWLTRSEAARLLRASRQEPRAQPHLPLFILIALYTGARRGAILGLRWTQVDLVRGRIDFNEPGRRRTNKRRSAIPIPRGLHLVLSRAHRIASSPWVVSLDGQSIFSLERSFRSACKRAGLGRDVTAHTLRHTAGTWMAQRGVPLHEIAGWLGHSNQRTTERYAHHHPDYLETARRAMERHG